MKGIKILIALFLFLGIVPTSIQAQAQKKKDSTLSPEELEEYKGKVRQLVSFLEFSLNTLGDPTSTRSDKDVIINQSFLKAFRDGKVQIEDDLIEDRETPTNKDIQAYLKDVDFFFKSVSFKFDIQDISSFVNDEGKTYFRVTMNRSLKGLKFEGDSIKNNMNRFLEVNLDLSQKDLKIASLYTTRLSEREDLSNWWNGLEPNWKEILGKNILVSDSLYLAQVDEIIDTTMVSSGERYEMQVFTLLSALKRATSVEILDLSNQEEIVDLEPVSRLENLKQLRLPNTKVNSLIPVRNLTKLEAIDASNTQIEDLSPLVYFSNLKELNVNGTLVSDFKPISAFQSLERLYANNTPFSDLSQLSNIRSLKDLRIGFTRVSDLSGIQKLSNLEVLMISGNAIDDLKPLSGHPNLVQLFCDNTPIAQISDELKGLNNLKRIYMDNTRLSVAEANRFRARNPGVLIVYQSENMRLWWDQLQPAWKAIFQNYVTIQQLNPSKEELAELGYITNIDISGNAEIQNIEPIRPLILLRELNISGTQISDLDPLKDLRDLRVLDASETQVSDISALSQSENLETLNLKDALVQNLSALSKLENLQLLNISGNKIEDFESLLSIKGLQRIYAENSGMSDEHAMAFMDSVPGVLVVYKYNSLLEWWNGLSNLWMEVFQRNISIDSPPSTEQIHALAAIEKIQVQPQTRIENLQAVIMLKRLKEISFIECMVASLTPLASLDRLEVLRISRNPITDLSPIKGLKNLRVLEMDYTPVSNIDALQGLILIEEIRASGTQVKRLNALSALYNLRYLDISTTGVNNLKPISNLKDLGILRCYNTKLNAKKVQQFRALVPGCEVQYY